MTSGFGLRDAEAVQEAVPETLIGALSVLTHLGSPVLLAVLVVAAYWLSDRVGFDASEGAFVLGSSAGVLSLTMGLKGLFPTERPPSALRRVAETGPSFPSLHAAGAAAVLFLVAEYADVGDRRVRYPVVLVLVAVVALSRVALGVSYPVDVLAGVVFASVYVLLVSWEGPDPEIAFSAALMTAVVVVALGSGFRVPVTVGVPLGGYVGWHLVDDGYDTDDILRTSDGVLVVLLPCVAVAMILPAGIRVAGVALGIAAATAGVVAAPGLAGAQS